MDMDGEINGEAVGGCLSSLVDDGTIESHRYYLSRKTVLEMLKDRGYAVPNSEIDLTLPQFRELYGPKPDVERLRVTTALVSDPNNKITVIFCGSQLVKVSTIRMISGQITNKESLSGIILIVENRLTGPAVKALDVLHSKVETFQYLVDRILSKLMSWNHLNFSRPTKLILINMVLVSSLHHIMSIMPIPL